MSDRTVLENHAVATVDESGAKYASSHLVVESLLVNGEPGVQSGEPRTADEREIPADLAIERLKDADRREAP